MTKKVKLTIIIALCVVIVVAAVLTTVLLLTNKESEPTLPDNTKQLTKSGHMLAVGGNTEYVILLPESNTSNEYLAANELSDIIFAATGARLEVVNEGKYEVVDGAPLISIGNTKLAEECNVRTDNTDLLRSGYFVKTVENRLFVMSDGDGIDGEGGTNNGSTCAYDVVAVDKATWYFPTTGGVGIYVPTLAGTCLLCAAAWLVWRRAAALVFFQYIIFPGFMVY